MYPGGALWDEANAIDDLRIVSLGKTGRWDLGFVKRLWNYLHESEPNMFTATWTAPICWH